MRRSHLDGQHDVRVALQHFHRAAVADVLKAYAVSSEDLIPDLYAILLSQAPQIQPKSTRWKRIRQEIWKKYFL